MIDRERHLRKLMLRALDGDVDSARVLLTEVRAHLVDYYRRRLPQQDAEDLAQDCLLAIHAKRSTYDRRLPFSAWAYAIARYKLIDHLRRAGRDCTVPIDVVSTPATQSPEATAAPGDVARVLSTLSEPNRALLEDVRIEGYSFAEAGARHGISEGAAKVRVHRTLKALSRWVSANDR